MDQTKDKNRFRKLNKAFQLRNKYPRVLIYLSRYFSKSFKRDGEAKSSLLQRIDFSMDGGYRFVP